MTNLTSRKDRYLRDTLPTRLGGLAANLARAHSFATNYSNGPAIQSLVEESGFFIEWTTPEANPKDQELLVKLQLELSLWKMGWQNLWQDEQRRRQMAEKANQWSQHILKISGLLQN